jgi:hypothetical protein
VYRGGSLGGLAELGCSDDVDADRHSRVSFDAVAGETYYLQAGGTTAKGGAEGGRLVFKAATVQPVQQQLPPLTPDPLPDPLPKPTASVALTSTKLKVDRHGRAHVRLRCLALNGASRCAGKLRLTRHRATVGKASYDIAGGHARTVLVRLSRNARRSLARRTRMPAVAHMTTRLDGAVVQAGRRRVSLR